MESIDTISVITLRVHSSATAGGASPFAPYCGWQPPPVPSWRRQLDNSLRHYDVTLPDQTETGLDLTKLEGCGTLSDYLIDRQVLKNTN
jgi:hypothetical protein